MKKGIVILLVSAMLLAGFTGCNNSEGDPAETGAVTTEHTHTHEEIYPLTVNGDTYIITEDMYVEGVDEISKNREKYIGKRIELEGRYMAELFVDTMYYSVFRVVTAVERHEHEDGEVHTQTHDSYNLGFRIKYEENNKPSNNDFVKVSGILEEYEQDGQKYLIINADYLKKTETPGKVYIKYMR